MTGRFRPGPCPGRFVSGLLLSLLLSGVAVAQEPPVRRPGRPPADSLPPDTLAVPGDTARRMQDTARAEPDTVPPPRFIPFPFTPDTGLAAGVWVWNRADLMREGAITLTDLLERIPGVVPIRAGHLGAPEQVAWLGGTAGRTEILLDGYVLDPLQAPSLDLSRIALVNLERVRVERRLDVLRIELETLAPTGARPYSLVEAGTGEPINTNLFRGTFLHPDVLFGPLGLAVERLDSDGAGAVEPADVFTSWVKWGVYRTRWGAQVEFERASWGREGESLLPGDGARSELILRGRAALRPDLVAEVYAGRSSVEQEYADSVIVPSEGGDPVPFRIDRSNTQAGVRARLTRPRYWGEAALRWRSREPLPGLSADASAGIRLPGHLTLSGALAWADWEGDGAFAYDASAAVGPFHGLRAFAELGGGTRGATFFSDSAAPTRITDTDALRAGVELGRWGIRAGAAFLSVSTDSLPTFGLPFDTTSAHFPGGEVRGWEAYGSVPLIWDPLSAYFSYTRWSAADGFWIYLPTSMWRAGLQLHWFPLPSGNLEILARLDNEHRGPMFVPQLEGVPAGTAQVAATDVVDFYLQIRVLSVRAFLRYEDILHTGPVFDIPGREIPGPRILYGVKWDFWN